MINPILLVPGTISFLTVLFLLPYWIRKSREIGLVWDDMNKVDSGKISGSGGIIVLLAFLIGILSYVGYRVFFLEHHNGSLVEIFALISSVLILACIGFFDDLMGWRKGGLSIRARIFLVITASVPLVAINSGKSLISLPFVGSLELGLIYPLLFIPVGIVGASTAFNILAGFNGLEAGNGILVLSGLAVVAFFTGNSWLSIVAMVMVFALIAFLSFNYYPAEVFPGDSLTYSVGGLIAIIAILGNFEKVAVFFFIPFVLETFLKLRGKLEKQSFGEPEEGGFLRMKYDKIYSLNHLAIYLWNKTRFRASEKKCVLTIWAFQLLVILIGFFVFRGGIFG